MIDSENTKLNYPDHQVHLIIGSTGAGNSTYAVKLAKHERAGMEIHRQ